MERMESEVKTMLPDTEERRRILAPIHAGTEPTTEQLKDSPELVGWDIGLKPEPHLVGIGFGHPRLPDARPIYTSGLVYLDPGLRFARTRSRFYRLRKHLFEDSTFPYAQSSIALTGEARQILTSALGKDAACKHMAVAPLDWSDDGIRIWVSGVPDGRMPKTSEFQWTPKREDVVELVRRMINARSQHWDIENVHPHGLAEDWWTPVRDEFPFIRTMPEFGPGWLDLIIGMSGWLAEHYDGHWHTSQTKEKFGELRVYHSAGDERSREIIDTAEWLSSWICEDCGAPGRLRKRRGWYRTVCDAHAEERGFA